MVQTNMADKNAGFIEEKFANDIVAISCNKDYFKGVFLAVTNERITLMDETRGIVEIPFIPNLCIVKTNQPMSENLKRELENYKNICSKIKELEYEKKNLEHQLKQELNNIHSFITVNLLEKKLSDKGYKNFFKFMMKKIFIIDEKNTIKINYRNEYKTISSEKCDELASVLNNLVNPLIFPDSITDYLLNDNSSTLKEDAKKTNDASNKTKDKQIIAIPILCNLNDIKAYLTQNGFESLQFLEANGIFKVDKNSDILFLLSEITPKEMMPFFNNKEYLIKFLNNADFKNICNMFVKLT